MKKAIMMMLCILLAVSAFATEKFVTSDRRQSELAVVKNGKPLGIYHDRTDHAGVLMACKSLCKDIEAVCGAAPVLSDTPLRECILVGSIDTPLISRLLDSGKIDRNELESKNEKYIISVVNKPVEGVDKALVIAGSDKRGTIYGVYELSRQMGISPWYWWMDVPVEHKEDLYIRKGTFSDGEPKVAYRGIFINDEWPSFGNWANAKFGGINSKCYKHVFELILRLKGNYLWPAMWGSAFYDDDKENGRLADKMGIVMGTSHHEPMALAQQDWKRRGEGEWNYVRNEKGLQDFWRSGMERAKEWETLVTVGMRGDGDEAMEDSGNIALMEKIVADQRKIISEVTGRPAEETPQVWALYKEVQDYYDMGMQVPDDITLMFCDDNWGNVRKLPKPDAGARKGGYGMYYHFDYVGGPRNSKWVNISPIPRIWEQMNLTYSYGVDKIWIVNVGDLKPMEYPITFFLDMAWDPERYNPDNLISHSVEFCRSIFGDEHAEEAARLLRTYAKFNRRVTPEQLNHKTYTMNYGEWERVTAEYAQLADDAKALSAKLSAEYQDAYFQLLGYPIEACSNLYEMYYAQAMNQRLAKKKDPLANLWADRVRECYDKDSLLTVEYHSIAGGKWKHMMDQVHIGYKSWNNPDKQTIPTTTRVEGEAIGSIVLPSIPGTGTISGGTFRETDGYLSIEAEHFTRKQDGQDAEWVVIPELGHTLSAMTTLPATSSPEGLALEYDMEIDTKGYARVTLRFSPTLNFNGTGLRYAIRFDSEEEQIVNINGHYNGELGQWQSEHRIDCQTIHNIRKTGKHTLRIRPLDPGLVLQKIMINMGGQRKSYLGAPETLYAE
ncbi:MAG: glycosyl hydrolase 115 family protein [Bacteroidales bacterium]|nr:glycosyl hydrolase 115 family protein [Bacteroidales bacterium]